MARANSTSPSASQAGTGSSASFFVREWFLPALFALCALIVLLPNVFALGEGQLYPVESDSAKYDEAAAGVAHFVHDAPSAIPKLFAGTFTPEERVRYDWESGVLQHAASYVIPLGITYAWFGHSETVGRLFTALLVAATAGLLVLWTGAHFGRFAAAVAGLAFVLWPAHVRFGTAIMTEMPMAFWILLSVVGLERTRRSTALFLVLGGALLGCGVLVKVSFRYLVVPFLLVDFLERGGTQRFRYLAWRALGVLAVFALWGGFLRGADLPAGGIVSGFETELLLFRGNYPEDRGFESVGLGDVNVPLLLEAVRENPESKSLLSTDDRMARIYLQALGKTIRDEPSRWLALVLAKAGWFWRWPGVAQDVPTWFGTLPPPSRLQLLVVAAGLVGLGVALLRGGAGLLPAVLFVYLTALHAGSHLVSRYNVPAIALFLPYFGGGVSAGVAALRALRFRIGGAGSGIDSRVSGTGGDGDSAGGAHGPRVWIHRLRGRWGAPFIALGAALVLFVLTLALPRDVWVGFGLPVIPAHDVHELTRFGVFLALGLFLFLHTRRQRVPWVRAAAVGLLPVLWGLAILGDAHADRDRDVWSARLSRPGDRIVQSLHLPDDVDWRAVRHAELFIDMMADAGSHPDVIVRLDGSPVRHFAEGLENPGEDYLLDRAVHAVQNRYSRVEEAYRANLDDYVLHRHPDADFSYFRQWFRIPVRVDSLKARREMVIEIELVDGRGGGVTVFGDAEIDPGETTKGQSRKIGAPAFLENPYELSVYQFVLFATDRMRADVRFNRPLALYSSSAEGAFFRDGRSLGNDLSPARGLQRGEYRVRLRTQLHGYYVRRKRGDRTTSTWAVWPAADEVPVSADDLRVLSGRRDRFFGGWRSY